MFGKLKHFFITQKDSTKYFEANEYRIYYKNKVVTTFHDRPQLHELHPIINKNFVSNGFSSFVKISTSLPQRREDRIFKEKFSPVEGIFYDDHMEKNYWKVGSDWFEVSGKYSFDVYAEYVRVLEVSLLDKDECSLKFLWPLNKIREPPSEDANDNKKKVEFSKKEYTR